MIRNNDVLDQFKNRNLVSAYPTAKSAMDG